ncbi:HNH endonuclease signature motif containing protein [Paenibacillus aceti]|uniref:HNH endonuclease signature motif containing protein n=1 Tax=Paenibacillus aceti TaxID=1820010 RepID=UPI001F096610|nr:HNH endonuclease signature motif containing protein [Paenibacillus aceti]
MTGNRLFSPTNSFPDSVAFSNLFEQLQEIQRQGLLGRLSPVKEDPRISSLLQTMQNGDSMARRLAQLELEKIAEAFTEIARSQKAYVVYQAYGHREYMESAHQYAEAQRKKLEEMGVSSEWYKDSIDLGYFYQGGLLEACRYNPLKNDRSLLLDDEEIRALLEQGMLGEVELDVLRQKYDELEVKVLHRQQLEQQLEKYNQLVAEEDIRKMQQLLKDMNLYHGEVTGEYNQELLIAVAGYQYIANNHSTLFAVWRELSGYHEGKEFEVDGLITKELIEVADAERGLGYWNDPGVETSGIGVAMTSVGVGDGIVSQVWDEGSGLVKQVWSVNPTNPKFWTETMPGYYDLAKAIAYGDITLEDIKEALKEGAAEEFVVPFQDIYDLQEKVLSGKANYEESKRYGSALVKAFLALMLVEGAVKSGAKISGKLSKQLSELLPKLNGGAVVVTEGGMKVKVPDTYRIETPESPDIQRKQYELDWNRAEGTDSRPDFVGKLKGGEIILPNVKTEQTTFNKRSPEETAQLRKDFNKIRKDLMQSMANDPVKIKELKKAGISDSDIEDMIEFGLVPDGWQVHHKIPLDQGGTNNVENLVLIKNDPYHKVITNEQNSLTKDMKPGDSKTVEFPIPEGDIYPPKKE